MGTVLRRKRAFAGYLFLTVFFAVYVFEYMVTISVIDQWYETVSGLTRQLVLHYMAHMFGAVGFRS